MKQAKPAPQGEAYFKGRNFKFMRFATVRYETPCGCVMERAMPAPGGSL